VRLLLSGEEVNFPLVIPRKESSGEDVCSSSGRRFVLSTEAGKIVWRGFVDRHPEALARTLQRSRGQLAKVGLESG
jgi:hypothetical protein